MGVWRGGLEGFSILLCREGRTRVPSRTLPGPPSPQPHLTAGCRCRRCLCSRLPRSPHCGTGTVPWRQGGRGRESRPRRWKGRWRGRWADTGDMSPTRTVPLGAVPSCPLVAPLDRSAAPWGWYLQGHERGHHCKPLTPLGQPPGPPQNLFRSPRTFLDVPRTLLD